MDYIFLLLSKTNKMRKSVLIKSLCVLYITIFSSCSNDDGGKDTTSNEKSILIKKITETIYYSDGSDITVQNFVYEKNVLKNVITNTRYKSEFEYDGDKITKVNYFRDEVAVGSALFYYNGDFLSYILSKGDPDEKTLYSYVDGILASEKVGYIEEEKYIVQREVLPTFDQAKNITEVISKSTLTGPEIISKTKCLYDNKNNPMKYMNKYYRMVFIAEGFSGQTTNNVVSRESYYPVSSEVPRYYISEIIYNNDNFPIEIKKISKENSSVISKTVIEYQ